MKKIAIAGNIASGKSQVERILKNSYPVIDTDKIAHELLQSHSNDIIKAFCDYDISDNGEINRKKLGGLVFGNTHLKSRLENILHPLIRLELEKFFEANKNSKLAFVGIPLVFEAGFDDMFDKIILVYANNELRLKRLMKRNDLTELEALARINSQQPQEEKIKKSDIIIRNEGSLPELEEQVERMAAAL